MNLVDQVEYLNKFKEKILEYEDYEVVTRNQFNYILFDLRTKLPLIEIRSDMDGRILNYMFLIITQQNLICHAN